MSTQHDIKIALVRGICLHSQRIRVKYSWTVSKWETYTFECRESQHIWDGRGRAKAREKKGEGKMSFDEEKFDDFFSRDPSGFTCGKIVFFAPPLFNRNEVLSCLERIFVYVFDTLKPSGLNKVLPSRQGTEEEEERRRKRARGEGESVEDRRERKKMREKTNLCV